MYAWSFAISHCNHLLCKSSCSGRIQFCCVAFLNKSLYSIFCTSASRSSCAKAHLPHRSPSTATPCPAPAVRIYAEFKTYSA